MELSYSARIINVRGYTVATAAVTLGVRPKWVDNTLSHHRVPGVYQSRQGIARRLTAESVVVLEIALRLMRSLSIPLHAALEISSVIANDAASTYSAGGCSVRIDMTAVRTATERRLAEAVEFAPAPRRGRPSTKDSARASAYVTQRAKKSEGLL
jgi:hypothetical protein